MKGSLLIAFVRFDCFERSFLQADKEISALRGVIDIPNKVVEPTNRSLTALGC